MKKVKIINGVYGARDSKTNRVTPVPVGGTVDVTDEEAARLVRLKVAKVVGEEPPADVVATPPAPGADSGAGENASDTNDGAEGQGNGCEDDDVLEIVDGHFTIESLMRLTRKGMDALADDLGIDTKKCSTKAEAAELIAAEKVETESGEEPPVVTGEEPPALGAENPVV